MKEQEIFKHSTHCREPAGKPVGFFILDLFILDLVNS